MAKKGPEGFVTHLLLGDQGRTVVSIGGVQAEGIEGTVGKCMDRSSSWSPEIETDVQGTLSLEEILGIDAALFVVASECVNVVVGSEVGAPKIKDDWRLRKENHRVVFPPIGLRKTGSHRGSFHAGSAWAQVGFCLHSLRPQPPFLQLSPVL